MRNFTGMIIKENELLAKHTLYKIGGPAAFFAEVRNAEEIKEALQMAAEKNLPFFILGAGSNVLVSDEGFKGLVIKMKDGRVGIDGEKMKVEAGVMMARAVSESAKAGLTGFEWGIGVPGTLGGSVRGNAGCFGGEMKDIIENVEIFDVAKSTSYQLPATSCEFSYRDSIFKRHPEWIILSATLNLKKGNPEEIKERIKSITLERTAKQDIGTQSCGCVFKNIVWDKAGVEKQELLKRFPELGEFKDKSNIPAAFLIDQAGLKGRKVGRAVISPKHANFFVNEGKATAAEIKELIEIAKKEVRKKFGLGLKEEIQYLG